MSFKRFFERFFFRMMIQIQTLVLLALICKAVSVCDIPDRSVLMMRLSEWLAQVENGCGDINTWDVSKVRDFSSLFSGWDTFNADISNWDMSNAENVANMFYGATSFNRDLSNWDTSSVTTMESMFNGATSFNGNIGDWNTGNNQILTNTFMNAHDFNGNQIMTWHLFGRAMKSTALSHAIKKIFHGYVRS